MENSKFKSNKKKIVSMLYLVCYILACLIYYQISTSKTQTNNSIEDIVKIATKTPASYTNAENLLKLAIEHNPYNEVLDSDLKALRRSKEAMEGLERYLKASCEKELNNVQILNNHAKFFMAKGKYLEAEEHLIKAISISPNFGESENLLMSVYHRLQKWAQLKKLSKEVIRNKNSINEGIRYLEIAQENKTVIEILEEATIKNPSASNHLELSKELYIQKSYAQSLHHANMALEMSEDLSKARLQLGLSYIKMGEPQKAIKTVKAGLGLDSNLELIGKRLAQLGDYSSAAVAYH